MSALDFWVACLWRASWQSAVLAAVVLSLNFLLRRRLSAAWRCSLWLLVAIRLMLPVLPSSRLSIFNLLKRTGDLTQSYFSFTARSNGNQVAPLLGQPGRTIVTVSYGPVSQVKQAEAISAVGDEPNQLIEILAAIWAGGLAILLIRRLVMECQVAAMVRRLPIVSDRRVVDLIEQCQKEIGVRRQIRIVNANCIRTPAICGIWRPTLILPTDLFMCDAELRMVLLHELAHLRRFDLQIDRILSLIRDVHWFNPIAWIMLRGWRAEREMACDEKVLRVVGVEHRQAYGQIILNLVERFSNLQPAAGAVGLFESHADLQRRIKMIACFKSSRIGWAFGFFILLSLVGGMLTNAKEMKSAPTTNTVMNQPPEKGEIVRIYDISDLIAHDSKIVHSGLPDLDKSAKATADPKEVAKYHATAIQEIMEAIRSFVPAISWKEHGGSGTLAQIQGQDQVIVTQSEENQEKISKILAVMRHNAGRRVIVEAHFVVVDTRVLTVLGILREEFTQSVLYRAGKAYLDDQKVAQLLKLIKSEEHCSVESTPQATVYDKQKAFISVEHYVQYVGDLTKVTAGGLTAYTPVPRLDTTGSILDVQPFIEPDNNGVAIKFDARFTEFVELKEVLWKNDPDAPEIQKPVIDVHERQSGSTEISIPTGSTLMMRLYDADGETWGRSEWVLIKPQIVEGNAGATRASRQ